MNVSYVRQIEVTENAIARIESRIESGLEEDVVLLKALKAYLRLLLNARA